MERRIYEAAVEGSVASLIHLLQEDALALDRFMVSCHSETPLHIASMLGHVDFVQEILSRKPELAGELDSRKASPLHLASAKGYLVIVKKLVSVNPEMCYVCDRYGRNPLHVAATKGHVNVMRELVQARPQAARMLMDRGETILHGCVRYNQLQSMKYLMDTLGDREFVNYKDNDGNTILHLAVADKQTEAIKILISSTAIEVNALNAKGLTALDMLPHIKGDEKDREIIELLGRASAISARDEEQKKKKEKKTKTPSKSHANNNNLARQDESDWLRKKRNTLMVVASLIATMAFQVGANPPGGLWQDKFDGDAKTPPHNAGSSILADLHPGTYGRFLASNSISFVASLSIILLLVSGLPIRSRILMWVLMVIMWVAITASAFTYLLSTAAFTPAHVVNTYASVVGCGMLVWFALCGILFLGHAIRLMVRIIKFIRKLIRKQGRRSSSQPSSSSGPMLPNHSAGAVSNLDNLSNVYKRMPFALSYVFARTQID